MSTHAGSHFEETLQKDIDNISTKVGEMANLGERALNNAIEAFRKNDRQLAYMVILRDQLIDDLEDELDRLCLEFILRQQPMAGHLRFVYAVLKITRELERIGDYAESIARQAIYLHDIKPKIDFALLEALAKISIPMFHDSVNAFLAKNVDQAKSLMDLEDTADKMRFQINEQLMAARHRNELALEALNPLFTIVRRLERVADQAKNICQETCYVVTGENIRHKHTDVFHILFVDEDNSSISQLAEGIGNSLENPRFKFSSAGMTAKPILPATMAFMAKKGIDISQQSSKSIQQILQKVEAKVVILLSSNLKKTRSFFPPPTIILDWGAQLPKAEPDKPAEFSAAHEQAFAWLTANIKDLMQAVLGQEK